MQVVWLAPAILHQECLFVNVHPYLRIGSKYKLPTIVLACATVLEQRLGRPCYVRQVRNRSEWFISDPMFSFVQHGFKKGETGYRVGYFYSLEEDELSFYMVHSPIMAQIFKKNLSIAAILQALDGCSPYLKEARIFWSSRSATKVGKQKWRIKRGSSSAIREFIKNAGNDGFLRDLFPQLKDSKWAGNDFYILLAQNARRLKTSDIAAIIDASWPLFLCLYPIFAIENRVASLARSLTAAGVSRQCEYSQISNLPDETVISTVCRGPIEGAHIMPHALGGTDKARNGLWLCQYHHRMTEGKLRGFRSRDEIKVSFDATL